MVIHPRKKLVTAAEFDDRVNLPENADKILELIGGEIVEVPSNPYVSYVGGRIFRRIAAFVEENDLGYTTGEAGGYMVSGERYAPDVAFISKAKRLAREGYNPDPPDLAVEVLSPSDDPEKLKIKIDNYLKAGTRVWVADADNRHFIVHAPGRKPETIGIDGILDGGDVLPGFKLPVREIFPES